MRLSKKMTFRGGNGDLLAARLDLPAREPVASALFAHCFTCLKDTLAASRISDALTASGIAVLRFDFTGLGGSEGEFANTNFSSNISDLVAAAEFLKAERGGPDIIIGHSLGGAAVLAAAPRIPSVRAVVTINAPCDPKHVLHLLKDHTDRIEKEGEADIELGGRRFRIKHEFITDVSMQRISTTIASLRKALLVLHSPQDSTVGIENARLIFDAARHPKSFVSLDGADHLLTLREDATYVATVIAAWASRYIATLQIRRNRLFSVASSFAALTEASLRRQSWRGRTASPLTSRILQAMTRDYRHTNSSRLRSAPARR